MLITLEYDRARAVEYARRWALSRNPLFLDFTGLGGNCTNFVSQCIFAGCGVMNYTETFGWYYISASRRAPAWTGVDEFYAFMTGDPEFVAANGGTGPFATELRSDRAVELGDVVQLANASGNFYHTLIVTGYDSRGLLVSAHSDDALDRPLDSYPYYGLRFLQIGGAKVNVDGADFFRGLLDGTSLTPLLLT